MRLVSHSNLDRRPLDAPISRVLATQFKEYSKKTHPFDAMSAVSLHLSSCFTIDGFMLADADQHDWMRRAPRLLLHQRAARPRPLTKGRSPRKTSLRCLWKATL